MCTGVWLVYWWPDDTSESGFQLVVAPSLVTPSCDLLYLKRAALLCLNSFTDESGNTWIEIGQPLLLYLDEVCEGSPDWHAGLFYFHWSWPWSQGICRWLVTHCARLVAVSHMASSIGIWHPMSCWRCCESRGFWAMHQVVRAHTCFTCFTTDWSDFVGLVWVLWGLFVFLCFFVDHWPICSSYQLMTIIAYLHDCHCRYDERSIVQKKKFQFSLSNCGSWYTDCRALCPGPSLQEEWHLSSMEQKKRQFLDWIWCITAILIGFLAIDRCSPDPLA